MKHPPLVTDKRQAIFYSYGCMSEVFEFMSAPEVTKFQGTNRWMYGRGVERNQKRFRLENPNADPVFFALRGMGVVSYDRVKESYELIEDMRFIFANSIALSIKSDIYCYYPADSRWVKYINILK